VYKRETEPVQERINNLLTGQGPNEENTERGISYSYGVEISIPASHSGDISFESREGHTFSVVYFTTLSVATLYSVEWWDE
jgi:hypothetical protein